MEKVTIEISKEVYERLKEELTEKELAAESMKEINLYTDFVGKDLFIRTVTYHFIGHVVKLVGNFLCLKDTVWVADSGRFMNAIKDGTLSEVEPIGDWFVNLESITDFGLWNHEIPKNQK